MLGFITDGSQLAIIKFYLAHLQAVCATLAAASFEGAGGQEQAEVGMQPTCSRFWPLALFCSVASVSHLIWGNKKKPPTLENPNLLALRLK